MYNNTNCKIKSEDDAEYLKLYMNKFSEKSQCFKSSTIKNDRRWTLTDEMKAD